jgi:hypothetical protein
VPTPTRMVADPAHHGTCFWVALVAGLYGVAHLFGLIPRYLVTRNLATDLKMSGWAWPAIPIFAGIAGGIGGGLISLVMRLIAHWERMDGSAAIWKAASFGTPIIVLIFLLVGALHIGLLRLLIQPEEHEWWARLSGVAAHFQHRVDCSVCAGDFCSIRSPISRGLGQNKACVTGSLVSEHCRRAADRT